MRAAREFLFRATIVELAVAVIIGEAFGAFVTALVRDILTPIVSLFGVPDFSTWTIKVGGIESTATFAVGDFINALIAFLLVQAAIFLVFIAFGPMHAMAVRHRKAEATKAAAPTEIELLIEIRDALRAQGR